MWWRSDRFPPAVENALRALGWSPWRGCASPERVDAWRVRHVPSAMSASAARALLEFGGLHGDHVLDLIPPDASAAPRAANPYRSQPEVPLEMSEHGFAIDPDRCGADLEALESAAHEAGESGMFPSATSAEGSVALAMGDSGAVYALRERRLSCLGRSLDEALEAILRGEPGFAV